MIKLTRAIRITIKKGEFLFVILALILSSFFLLFGAETALAQVADPASENYGLTPGEGIGEVAIGQTSDLMRVVALVINIALGFLGIVAVGLCLYAGFLWMTARGNEDQVKKAKTLLRNAIIGLVIILSAWAIAAFVIRQLSGATGGDTGGGGGGDGGGGTLPAERFTLQEFQTSHAGRTNRDDVFRCSAVQTRLNHWLNNTSVANARANFKALVTGVDYSHRGDYQPVTESLLAVDINSSGNVVAYRRVNNDTPTQRENWPPYSQIEIQFPKSVTDTSDKPLADCTALGCNERGDHYAWTFTTTDKTDSVNPSLVSSYPPMPGSREGYPNRNIDRSVTFTLNFSEAIDFFSVAREDGRLIPERIRLDQIASATDFTPQATIPTEHLDVSLSETGIRFALNRSHQSSLNDGPYLEPFSWYRLALTGVTDLCGNPLMPATMGIVFQTNGNIPGVEFTYPRDGYQFACPSTETFVQFRTSMYDVRTSSCAVNPDGGGLVMRGSGIAGRSLGVRDNLPVAQEGVEINPNNFCRRYDFLPATAELVANSSYSPVVEYKNPANDSQTERANWGFGVKPAGECANAPYISRVSPGEGPWGRCLTIEGNYFGAAAYRAGSDSFTHLDLDSPRNLIPSGGAGERIRGNWTRAYNNGNGFAFGIQNSGWQDTYLTGQMPNIRAYQDSHESTDPISLLPPSRDGVLDFDVSVTRNITLAGRTEALKSNIVNFAVPENEPAYAGPCLTNINPGSGAWATPVELLGTNFGAGSGGNGQVTFTNRTFNASVTDWRNSRIETAVPDQSQDGLVHVATDQGVSNGLPFDVANGRGGSCRTSNDCAPPLICSGGVCTDPPRDDERPAGFRVESAWPSSGCSNTCTNAAIGLETNLAINRATMQPAVYNGTVRIGGSLAVRRCQDRSCSTFLGNESEVFNSSLEEDKRLNFQFTLVPRANYRVIVFGGANGLRSTDGKELAILNYDSDNNGSKDAYSWYFTIGANTCSVSRLEMDKPHISLYENEGSNLTARVYSRPDSCSPQDGQLLDPSTLTGISWRACAYQNGNIRDECSTSCSAPNVGSEPILIVNSSNTVQNVVTARKGSTSGNNGLACVFIGGDEIKNGSVATVRSHCQEDSDCVVGARCLGSICNRTGVNAGRCTPVINSILPNNGRAGTWVTINGCYFGNQAGTVSGATSNTIFEVLPVSCGSTWGDDKIITQSPTALTSAEPIKITKHTSEDGQSATSRENFTPNTEIYPGLCRTRPDYGPSRSEVRLMGKNFGVRNTATDKVIFTHETSTVEALDIKEWSDTASSTAITLAVPVVNNIGDWNIRVKKADNFSNPINFRVISSSTPTTPGGPKDLKVLSYAPGAGNRACPAMIVEVILEGTLDLASITSGAVTPTTPNNFMVKRQGETESLAGELLVFNIDGAKTQISFLPAANLAFNTSYSIIFKGGDNGLRSYSSGRLVGNELCDSEVLAQSGECVINFSVLPQNDPALADCEPSSLSLTPANPLYTCAGTNNCPGDSNGSLAGNQSQFLAELKARNGQPLHTTGSAYTWSSSDDTILSFEPSLGTDQDQVFTVNPKNGLTRIGAEVTLSGKRFSAATRAQVFLCQNPWPPYPGTLFKDVEGAGFTTGGSYSNFSTFYCRDKGAPGQADDLPILDPPKEFTSRQGVPVQDFIKEIFLTQPQSKKCQGGSRDGQVCSTGSDCGDGGQCVGKTDAIGIRILKNPDHDSTVEWYSRQSFAQGSPQSLRVDGYDGVRDGRTVYVNAPNDSDGEARSADNSIFTNIYLISINDQAQAETQNIFEQLVSNWRFAANIDNSDNSDRLRRDTKRLADIRRLADMVETYTDKNEQGMPPKLEAGSFTKNLSVSVWPSWANTLAVDLGITLPTDPSNIVNRDECLRQGAAADTCWRDRDKVFVCTAGSYAYQYEYHSANSPYFTLRANLEYQPRSWTMPPGSRWILTGTANSCQNLRYGVDR